MKGLKKEKAINSSDTHKVKDPTKDRLVVNMNATLLFRHKLAQVQKQLQSQGII